MMTRQQYLLLKVAEEAGELAKQAMKAMQFGLDSIEPGTELNNYQNMNQELNDLMGALSLLNAENNICRFAAIPGLILGKQQKIDQYYEVSHELGFVEANHSKVF